MVIIRCNKCGKDEMPGAARHFNIHITMGKGGEQSRGHLCHPCNDELCRLLKLTAPKEKP